MKNMKEEVLEKVNSPELQRESVFILVAMFRALKSVKERNEFISVIGLLAMKGTNREKFISLVVVEFLEKAHLFEEVIKLNVLSLDFSEDEQYISPLLTLCVSLSNSWSIEFVQRIIKFFKPNTNEYVYYFDIGLRSFVCTKFWKERIEEIIFALQIYDDEYVIDFIAFFKWKQNKKQLKIFFKELSIDSHLLERIDALKEKIEDRYLNHYKDD